MNSNSSRTQTETSHNDEINQRQLLVSNSSRQLEEVSEMVSEESSKSGKNISNIDNESR